jgi:hypothetical protein
MAVNWFASLKDVPWTKVIGMAPTIVENGRKLWDKVANRNAEVAAASAPKDPPPTPLPEALAQIEFRLGILEKKSAQLREEAVASFDVVRSMADQHSQLVHAVDVLLVRTRVLVRVCVMLGVACVALLALILSR